MVCTITKKECFECGSDKNVTDHHVVPEVLGGTKTVFLCEACHGKVHDRSMTGTVALTKAGLEIARKKGVRLGGPNMVEVRKNGKISVDPEKLKLVSFVQTMMKTKDLSQRDLAGYLNGLGVKSTKGKRWHHRPLQRALKLDLSQYDVPAIYVASDLHQDYYEPNFTKAGV